MFRCLVLSLPLNTTQTVFNSDVGLDIRTHAFSNPNVEDLLAALSTTDPRMAARMRPWLYAAGFPVVLVAFNPSSGVITFTQVGGRVRYVHWACVVHMCVHMCLRIISAMQHFCCAWYFPLSRLQKPISPTLWSQDPPVWWVPVVVRACLNEEALDLSVSLEAPVTTVQLPRGGPWKLRVDLRSSAFAIFCYEGLSLSFCVFFFVFRRDVCHLCPAFFS